MNTTNIIATANAAETQIRQIIESNRFVADRVAACQAAGYGCCQLWGATSTGTIIKRQNGRYIQLGYNTTRGNGRMAWFAFLGE